MEGKGGQLALVAHLGEARLCWVWGMVSGSCRMLVTELADRSHRRWHILVIDCYCAITVLYLSSIHTGGDVHGRGRRGELGRGGC